MLSTHQDRLQKLTQKLSGSFFYYDIDALQAHINQLQHLPVTLWYALKANPLSSIIQALHKTKMRFDVASIGELEQVLKQGVSPHDILHTGPAKSFAQLQYFVEKGVRIFVIESIQQFHDIVKVAAEKRVPVQVLLRVQLAWPEAQKNVLGGHGITPFGLMSNDWVKGLAKVNLQKIPFVDVIGLHCFQWGNILSADKLYHIWHTSTTALIDLASKLDLHLRVIDLGGGLGISYQQTHLKLTVNAVQVLLNTLKTEFPNIDYWLELGRFAVGEFGCYVTKVIDRKVVADKHVLVLEGGSQHLLRPALTGQPFPCALLRKSDSLMAEFQLHGPLCTGLDQLGSCRLPDDIQKGDYLVFGQTGAYGFTESMPFFLCHTLPAEVVCADGHVSIIRENKGADSWLV
ncbi:PLP-dependent decarboxylase [Facilibium subflavum]|uniref:PLP-dependent decarboxylase n=1 Tax=Facilibium subflavum TaxID=2219058 RepID=UPI000E652A96|nr:PLP-dependent decarboxylase [Facilibium subflavum]